MESYFRKGHEQCEQDSSPDPLSCPEFHERNRESNAGKEEWLHEILLSIQEVKLECVNKLGTLVCVSLALFAAHHNKWTVWMLAWQVREKSASQERTKQDRGAGICCDADEGR